LTATHFNFTSKVLKSHRQQPVAVLKSQSLFSSHTQSIDFDQSMETKTSLSGVRETCSLFKIEQNKHQITRKLSVTN